MKKLLKQIPTMKSKPLSHDKKYYLIITYIGGACYLTHFAVWDDFFVNQKTQICFPVRGNLVVLCNLTGTILIISFNGVKREVVDVSWALYFCFCGVTHEWMSSIFEVLLLFWFVVIYFLSRWDEMDVRVKLLADDVRESEYDKNSFLSVEVVIFNQLFFKNSQFPCTWCKLLL